MSVLSVFAKEGIVLLLLSASFYLLTYKIQESYLKYFGVSSVFVKIDTLALISSGGIFLGVVIVVWLIFGNIPSAIYVAFAKVFLAFGPCWMLLIVAFTNYYISGFSWVVVIAVSIAIFYFTALLSWMCWAVWSGSNFTSWFERQISDDLKVRGWLAQEKAYEVFGFGSVFVVLILAFVPIVLGPYLGSSSAARERIFLTFMQENTNYMIISSFDSGVVAIEFESFQDEKEIIILTGQVAWYSLESINGISLESLMLVKPIDRGIPPRQRTSLRDFCSSNGISFC